MNSPLSEWQLQDEAWTVALITSVYEVYVSQRDLTQGSFTLETTNPAIINSRDSVTLHNFYGHMEMRK